MELAIVSYLSTHVLVSLLIVESAINPLKMSTPNQKRRKGFLNKFHRVFKRKEDELEQLDVYNKQEKVDDRQADNLGSASCSSDQKIGSKARGSETCVTVPKNSLSGKEHNDKNLSDMRVNCKNVVGNVGNESSRFPNVDDKISEQISEDNVRNNEQGHSQLGSDRHMSTKIAFLKQDNDIGVSSRSSLGDTGKVHHDNGTKSYSPDSKSAMLQSLNNASVTGDTRKFLVKETKAISQESSEDSDFSADSTEDSFEDSSEDEIEHLIESEKARTYFKDEYFTKGKYITYFFLEMERQFYDPTDVYSMVQYHDTACEKPGKEGTERYTKFICCLKFYNSFVFFASILHFVLTGY